MRLVRVRVSVRARESRHVREGGGGGGRGQVPGAREGRAPLLPIESENEEMKLPLTLEIQARVES